MIGTWLFVFTVCQWSLSAVTDAQMPIWVMVVADTPSIPDMDAATVKKKRKKSKNVASVEETPDIPKAKTPPETTADPNEQDITVADPQTKEATNAKKKRKKSKDVDTVEEPQKKPKSDLSECSESSNQQVGFTILGGHDFARVTKVKSILPNWLAKPTHISSDLASSSSAVEEFPVLDDFLVAKLKARGIERLFPVQAAVVPYLLSDRPSAVRDLCVSAPTGSGKTLSYVLPVVQRLRKRFVPRIRALVVVPVQELAIQVCQVFREYVEGTELKVEAVTGSRTPLETEQRRLIVRMKGVSECYESRVDILVATPGRLVEHLINTKGFDLTKLKFLIIDEADRVMENVQNNWLYHLERHIYREGAKSFTLSLNSLRRKMSEPRKLLFSATLSHDPEKLKMINLFQPKLFSASSAAVEESRVSFAGKFATPEELEEYYIVAESTVKPLILSELILGRKYGRILCFTKSVEDAHRLTLLLKHLVPQIQVREMSSALSSDSRDSILSEFSRGDIDVLVSSDVMARGVDIPNVDCVISYDPPKQIRGYVHRAGRTGRAGVKGMAITLTTPTQSTVFLQGLKKADKEDLIEMRLAEDSWKGRMDDYKRALASLKSELEREANAKVSTLKDTKRIKRKRNKKK